jgi:RNAse (barnase) inhibitor barstar
MDNQTFTIDGNRISDLETFYDEFAYVFLPDVDWGRNLDSLRDVFRGGFGIPDENFVLVWKNSGLSRQVLGYEATVHFWENVWARSKRSLIFMELEKLGHEYSDGESKRIGDSLTLEQYDPKLAQSIALAKNAEGETVFDWIVEILREYPRIELRLE